MGLANSLAPLLKLDGMRAVSLTLNMGTVIVLGGAAGQAAGAAMGRRQRHTAAAPAGAPAVPSSSSSSSSSPRSLAGSSSSSAGAPAVALSPARVLRPSRWLRDRPLYSGAVSSRGFASMPCPLSDDEDEGYFEFDQQDYRDLEWQWRWQQAQQQEALLAARRAWDDAQRQLEAQLQWAAAQRQPPAAISSSSSSGTAEPSLPAAAAAALEQQQQARAQAPLEVHRVAEAAGMAGLKAQGAAPAVLPPWERLSVEERLRRLVAFRAEALPYAKRSVHSMSLPFLLEAYSAASPPAEGAGVSLHPPRPEELVAPEEQQLQLAVAAEQQRCGGGRGGARESKPKEWAGARAAARPAASCRALLPLVYCSCVC